MTEKVDIAKEEIRREINVKVNFTKDEVMNDIKEENKIMKESILREVNDTINHNITNNAVLHKSITTKMVKCKSDIDKRESHDRGNNIIFSGIADDTAEKTNRGKTAEILINELSKISCTITRDDVICHRIYRRNGAPSRDAPLILARFISPIVRNKVMSYKSSFKNSGEGRFMNEDMTALQRSLFNYLRTKEDIILKKTVGFKDGKVIFLLKKNEHSTSRQKWSYAHNILDLADIDTDLEVDLTNEGMMSTLGLKDCMWTTN